MNANRMIANTIFHVVGGVPQVINYQSDYSHSIDIFISMDRPESNLNCYATIGLSNYSIGFKLDHNKDLRTEFIGVCKNNFELFPNIAASCAFRVIHDQYSCKPGTVYLDVIDQYYPDSEMKHMYFTVPFLWDNLGNLEVEHRIISWLMMIPISQEEFMFLQQHGDEALEDLFEKNNIDPFDLFRPSIV